MDNDFRIIKPFNTIFNLVFAGFLLILIIASLLVSNKSESTKQIVLVTACILALIGFAVYKYYLSNDSEYNVATASMGGFNWWGELPLQLCNINMLLIPIAVITKNQPLSCICFFVGPLGALMALIMPGIGFNGYSLLLPRMLGYYGTHFMVLIEGLALVTFGLFKPRLHDLPRAVLITFVIGFAVFLFNVFLRRTGLHPKANYFFTMETEGNFVLEIFYKWIPYPFLYLLPSIVILATYMVIITIPFEILALKGS